MHIDPFDIPADLDTPVSAFLKLAPFRPRFLLESVVGREHLGRFSILGFGEVREVRVTGSSMTIDGNRTATPTTASELLDALRGALAAAPRPGPDGPFRGGLVGVAGFDFVRRLGRLPRQPPRTADTLEAIFLAPVSVLVFDHAWRRAALLHAGTDAERTDLRREVRRALAGPIPATGGRTRYEPPRAESGPERFIAGVDRAKHAIREGDVYQLVLSEGFSGECELAPLEVYRALRLLNPSPYMFLLDLGAGLSVVGSSPEVLVKLKGNTATLRPIAGTRPRGADPKADLDLERELLADPKEAAEHVMLVDLARNDLGRVALPGTIRVDPYRIIERYSHVMHIVSGVEGTIAPEHDQFDLFAAAFPAGTVVGAPKVRAMELIEEIEPSGRGLYAGTVGYFGHDNAMDQAIAIRTIVFDGGRYSYRAGAGIVADSVPQSEHHEVLAKGRALGAALRLASEGL
jgi:anthranilate synthase component 1